MSGHRTPSGVFVFDDFRENLIIDRYDPIFNTMRGEKIEKLRSVNSEDALTWNVFRSLRQVSPAYWFPRLFARAFPADAVPCHQVVGLHLWPKIAAPPALRLLQKDEGDSEIDVLIETERALWPMEAKYRSDVSERTTNNAQRDQVLRNLDVGSWHAGLRDFYFTLLVLSASTSAIGAAIVGKYSASKNEVLTRLPHRPDGLPNLKAIGSLEWTDVADVLANCAESAPHEDERGSASRAVAWLASRSISATTT